jgi:hypothetical protein
LKWRALGCCRQLKLIDQTSFSIEAHHDSSFESFAFSRECGAARNIYSAFLSPRREADRQDRARQPWEIA